LLDWSDLVARIGSISASKATYSFCGAIYFLGRIASRFGFSLTGCIDHVIPIINARPGKFNEHGIWVKDPQPVAESSLAGIVISAKAHGRNRARMGFLTTTPDGHDQTPPRFC